MGSSKQITLCVNLLQTLARLAAMGDSRLPRFLKLRTSALAFLPLLHTTFHKIAKMSDPEMVLYRRAPGWDLPSLSIGCVQVEVR